MSIKIQATVEIVEMQICDLLCNAFEGGSHYWLAEVRVKKPVEGVRYTHDVPMAGGEVEVVRMTEGPEDLKLVKHTLTRERCIETVQILARDYRKHFTDLMNDNTDAETGDVFLQLALLGEVVFG